MESQRSGRCEPCFRGDPPKNPVQLNNKIICGDCECVAFVIVAETVSEDGQRVIYGHTEKDYE